MKSRMTTSLMLLKQHKHLILFFSVIIISHWLFRITAIKLGLPLCLSLSECKNKPQYLILRVYFRHAYDMNYPTILQYICYTICDVAEVRDVNCQVKQLHDTWYKLGVTMNFNNNI